MDELDERGGWLARFTRPVEQTPEQRGDPRGESFRSYASVAAYLPPERPYLRRLKLIVALMALASALNTVASSWLTYVAGDTQAYYEECAPALAPNASLFAIDGLAVTPNVAPGRCRAWQFCLVYADTMVGPVNAQLPFAGAGQALSTLGMQVLIFGWLAVATTFRALYHYEWIPSTAAFQLYSLVAMTVYQSLASNVVAYPNQMGSSLLAATQFVFGKARATAPRRAARAR